MICLIESHDQHEWITCSGLRDIRAGVAGLIPARSLFLVEFGVSCPPNKTKKP